MHGGEIQLRQRLAAKGKMDVRVNETRRDHRCGGQRDGWHIGARRRVDGGDAAISDIHTGSPWIHGICGPKPRAGQANTCGQRGACMGHEGRAYPINHEAKLQQRIVRMRVKYAGHYLRESCW